ncbi:hypothetical protein HDZ31DRAFT_44248 [Schizophyllum fasciatum]
MEAPAGATMGFRPLPFFHLPFGLAAGASVDVTMDPAPTAVAAPRPRVLRRSRARIPQTVTLSRDRLLNASSRPHTPTLVRTPTSPPANVDAMDVDEPTHLIPHAEHGAFPSSFLSPLSSPPPTSTLLAPMMSPLLDDLDEFSGLAQLDTPAPICMPEDLHARDYAGHLIAPSTHLHADLEPTPLAASRKCVSNRSSLSGPLCDAAARGSGRWEGILGASCADAASGAAGAMVSPDASGSAPLHGSLLGKGARKRSSEDISGATFGGLELTRRRRIG